MINYTENYFNLQILRISDIKLHETTENYRFRNVFERITRDRFLLNPVIVGKSGDDYILIDGANRLKSLIESGCKLVIVQIVDYLDSGIKIKNWNHLIYEFDINLIKDFCSKNNLEFRHKGFYSAEMLIRFRPNFISVTDISNSFTNVIKLSEDFEEMIYQMNSFTGLYFNLYDFDRSENEISISDLKKYTRKSGLLAEFPKFGKKKILKVANGINKIPAGITRHILVNRVLHIKYDLELLLDDKDIGDKNRKLNEYLIEKIDNNKVRQYTESVIVFDE